MLRGEFREDLYYRLKVIEVTVPPLRERRGEIAHLTQFFIDRYARRYNRPVRQLSEELQQPFQTYEWPGNIRELENMIKRIVILQDESLVIREMARRPRVMMAYGRRGRRRGRYQHWRERPSDPAPAPEEADDDLVDVTDESAAPEVPWDRRRALAWPTSPRRRR